MTSPISPTSPVLERPAVKRRRRNGCDSMPVRTDLSHLVPMSVVQEITPLPAVYYREWDRGQMDVHTRIVESMDSVQDMRSYINALKLPQQVRTWIGNSPASRELIFNTFTRYCKEHPESYVTVFVVREIDSMQQANPVLKRVDALAQILQSTLQRNLNDFKVRDVLPCFNDLDTYYQSLHERIEANCIRGRSQLAAINEGREAEVLAEFAQSPYLALLPDPTVAYSSKLIAIMHLTFPTAIAVFYKNLGKAISSEMHAYLQEFNEVFQTRGLAERWNQEIGLTVDQLFTIMMPARDRILQDYHISLNLENEAHI